MDLEMEKKKKKINANGREADGGILGNLSKPNKIK